MFMSDASMDVCVCVCLFVGYSLFTLPKVCFDVIMNYKKSMFKQHSKTQWYRCIFYFVSFLEKFYNTPIVHDELILLK